MLCLYIHLLHDEAREVPLTAALICQNLLREHTSSATAATNADLFSLWRAYEGRDITTKELLVQGSAVMSNAYAARLNSNIRQVLHDILQQTKQHNYKSFDSTLICSPPSLGPGHRTTGRTRRTG